MGQFLTLLVGLLGILALVRKYGTRAILTHAERHVPASCFRPDLEVVGSGDEASLVVLLHGTFCDGQTVALWRDAMVAAGHEVWVYEYRYLDAIPRNAARLEQAMGERLRARGGVPKITLVGYSQGGMVARWLVTRGGTAPWLRQVRGLLQVASPNLGSEPSDLAKLFWYSSIEDPAPALTQLQRRSRFLQALDGYPLPAGLDYGVIYGVGRGREVLGRFWGGGPEGRAWTRLLGRFYEAVLLPPEETDGLVSTASALALLSEPGRGDACHVHMVKTDHLGLLVHPEVSASMVAFVARALEPSPAH